jgi:hypothetical protein
VIGLYESWLNGVVKLQDTDLLHTMLHLNPSRTRKAMIAAFNTVCQLGNAQIVNQLVQKGHMRVNAGSVRSFPLSIAIRSLHLHIIDAVLDRRRRYHDPGSRQSSKRKNPPQCMLEIDRNKEAELIEHLIKRGAIVPPEISKWDRSSQRVYDAMRTARISKGGVNLPTYEEVKKLSKEEFMKL